MITTVSTGTILNNFAQTVIQGFSMSCPSKTGRRAFLFNPPMGVNSPLRSARPRVYERGENRGLACGDARHKGTSGGYDE